jgi:signal transduction histidine kinase
VSAPIHRGLFRKYAIVLSLLVGVTLLAGVAAEVTFNYNDSLEATTRLQRAEARGAAVRIDGFLGQVRGQLVEVATLPWAALDARERRQEYLRLMKLVPAIAELRHVDAEGRERLRVSRERRDEVDSMRKVEPPELLAHAQSSAYAFSQTYFKEGSEPYVTLAVKEGDAAGVSLAEINLKFVADVVSRIRVGDAGFVYVLDSANQVVAHPDLSVVLGRSALPDLDRDHVVASVAHVPAANWRVVVEQPRAEVLQPLYGSLLRSSILLAVALVTALVASYFLARKLVSPIVEVRYGAQRIAGGDLAARINVKTGDEVEALATDFNRMAEQLQDYTTGLERKVDEKTAKLQEAMRARALFLAAASHDLRQPLYAISILADTLALHEMAEPARQTLAKQREAIAVLRGLFDNLLDLSRFDSGEIRAVARQVSLREILMPVAMEHEVVSRAKGLEWHCEIADAEVRTDPELLRRLVGNLLSNASRYTPSGSVRLAATIVDGVVRIEVSDTGVGIPPELQGKVFEEFVQLDNPSRERDRGVGLGLSIVKKIDGLLGSRLRLESKPNEGTRITFELPLAEAGALARTGIAADDIDTGEFAGVRVWVVEDDPMVRDALAGQFAAWGVDHAFASTRAEVVALRQADGAWPEAAMLDDMLGATERGLSIAHWLAGHIPRERISLVTGNVEPGAARELQDSGFKVLRKPLSSIVIAQWLHGAVGAPRSVRAAVPGE